MFAYSGAVIAAAGSFARQGVEGMMLFAIGSALIALAATVFILWPQTFWDSPDAEKLATILSQDHPRAKVVEVLLKRQLDDGAANEVVLDGKRFALRVAIIGAIVATGLLFGEIAQGRGM
ncbi:MAG: hypothetical protein M3O89_04750 [Actinomycetota bacterium]|nr:hypothetical protein [Actinomycetota bacterium]